MEKEYVKDFDAWHPRKKMIDAEYSNLSCGEREIWWCSLGVNIGVEEDGKQDVFERPVLVVKKISQKCIWVLPCSSSIQNNKYRHIIKQLDTQIILSQIRTIDTKRLLRKITMIPVVEFDEIIKKLIAIVSPQDETPALSGGISEAEATVQ